METVRNVTPASKQLACEKPYLIISLFSIVYHHVACDEAMFAFERSIIQAIDRPGCITGRGLGLASSLTKSFRVFFANSSNAACFCIKNEFIS